MDRNYNSKKEAYIIEGKINNIIIIAAQGAYT